MKTSYLLRFICLTCLLAITLPSSAQVSGISYSLSPSVNYTLWDNQAGLEDGLLAGGHLGIGFGENVELRGMYLFDLDLKRDFSGVLDQELPGLAERDVNLSRYGGEIRLNIGRSRLLPFLTLGAGIQSLELDGGLKNEHVYASGGLGVTLKVADRFTLKIEGKNTAYNFNPVRNLLTEEERTNFLIDENDFFNERMSNWSIGTGLTVYLGGRRPGTLTEVDRAYAEVFTDGFRGVSLLVEPTISHINFDDDLPYRDMWLGGASLGLDFGPLVGFRAFYLRGMDDNKLSLDFDNIAVYGADFRFRFSSATTGLAPFLTLGGGYIGAQDDYVGRDDLQVVDSQAFASGGGGISLNLGRNLSITGTYKALLTTSSDLENLESADEIRSSGQWSAGINLAFGKKARRPDAMFTSTAQANMQRAQAEATLEKQVALAEQAKMNAEATKQLKNDYEVKIYSLSEELATARSKRDTTAIDSLEAVIERTEQVVAELENREKNLEKTIFDVETQTNFLQEELKEQVNAPVTFSTPEFPPKSNGGLFSGRNADGTPAPPVSRLSFTPAEFEGLIEEIFEGLNYGMPPMGMMPPGEYDTEYDLVKTRGSGPQPAQDTARINEMERQLTELKTSVMELAEKQEQADQARASDKEALREEMKESTQSILDEIRAMRQELSNKSNLTDKEREQMKKDADKAAKEAEKAARKAKKKNDGL